MSRLEGASRVSDPESTTDAPVPQTASDRKIASGLYVGRVRHRRFEPVRNDFTYSGFWLYLDLTEIDEVFQGRWLWSSHRTALMRFRREDHLLFPDDIAGSESDSASTFTDEAVARRSGKSHGKKPQRSQSSGAEMPPLEESVRSLVELSTGLRPAGPIRLLTQLRCFGYLMNPVSFFYCYDKTGSRVETVVAEVNNTPWGERHCYVLDATQQEGSGNSTEPSSFAPLEAVRISSGSTGSRHLRFEHKKRFHVSPFMQMDMSYRWRIAEPHNSLTVQIENWQSERRIFDCTFHLKRRSLTGGQLARVLVRHPFMTGKFVGAIYWQALKLWWKGCPFVPHPNSKIQEASQS